jgi:ABC-type dipeptide/oligopeptide/nickel transport system permease component
MGAYTFKRVLLFVPTLIGISLLGFGLAALTPGDPATQYLIRVTDTPPTPEAVERVRSELGLDRPLPVRYADWVVQAAQGDLGTSYATRQSVTEELARRLPATAELAVPAALLSLAVALPLGSISAAYRNRPIDQVLRVGAIAGASMPSFWLALLLIAYLAVPFAVLPVAGRSGVASGVLPVLVLAAAPTATLARFTRSTVLEALSEDYIVTARTKGLTRAWVVGRHAVRNSLIPVVTAFGTSFGHLLSGTVIVETIFAWPGVGKLAVDAIVNRDYPVVQGFILYAGALFVILNLLVDLTYGALDPRIRYGRADGGA